MIMNRDPEERAQIDAALSQPLVMTTTGGQGRDADAPTWWLGDEEAYRSSMGAAQAVSRKGL